MDGTRLEITLKNYLDEKYDFINDRFEVVHSNLDKLESLRQDEHDIVVSMTNEIKYRTEEIDGIKKNAAACKTECLRRKDDFDERVISIVDPRITEKTTRLWITLITGAVIFLASVAGYLVDKVFFPDNTERVRVHRTR